MKKAKKASAKKGAAPAATSKPVNLTAPDSEVTGQGLGAGKPARALAGCPPYDVPHGCGVRG